MPPHSQHSTCFRWQAAFCRNAAKRCGDQTCTVHACSCAVWQYKHRDVRSRVWHCSSQLSHCCLCRRKPSMQIICTSAPACLCSVPDLGCSSNNNGEQHVASFRCASVEQWLRADTQCWRNESASILSGAGLCSRTAPMWCEPIHRHLHYEASTPRLPHVG